jgi:multimeric flavodoxin WrbA
MKVIAFNGSYRKDWNTGTLLRKVLEGAASQGAETKLIHLYDLNYKGCRSCFACKTKNGKSYGECIIKDDLEPIFKEIKESDVIILGTPIYFRSVSGEMKSFLERLLYPNFTYTNPPCSLLAKSIKVGFIYTMNNTEAEMKKNIINDHLEVIENTANFIFGPIERLYSFDTFQFFDYSKVVADKFDPEMKAIQREKQFPLDCEKAFEMGKRFVNEL